MCKQKVCVNFGGLFKICRVNNVIGYFTIVLKFYVHKKYNAFLIYQMSPQFYFAAGFIRAIAASRSALFIWRCILVSRAL